MKKLLFASLFLLALLLASCGEHDAHTHTYTANIVPPTCHSEGYTEHTCACGNSYRDTATPKTEHTFRLTLAEVQDDRASCVFQAVCSLCGEAATERKAHSLSQIESIPATCDKEGYTLSRCDTCGYLSKRELSKKEHTYLWTVTGRASPENVGMKQGVCSLCEYTLYSIIHYDSHTHEPVQTVIPPTCTAQGYTKNECLLCTDAFSSDQVPPLPHTYREWQVTLRASEDTEGCETRTCADCGYTDTRAILFSAHTHLYRDTVIPADCSREGYTRHDCLLCTVSTQSTPTPRTPHSYGEWQIGQAATDDTPGILIRTCTACEARDTHTESYELKEPSYTLPTLSCEYGTPLSAIVLPLGFSFEGDTSATAGDAGERKATLSYRHPEDPDGLVYKHLTGIEVTITVLPKLIRYQPDTAHLVSLRYTGKEISLPALPLEYAGILSIGFRRDGEEIDCIPKNAGSYTLYVYATSANYTLESEPYSFRIEKAGGFLDTLTIPDMVYSAEPHTVTLPAIVEATLLYLQNGVALNSAPREVGSYTLTVQIAESENIHGEEKTFSFSILPDTTPPRWHEPESYRYDKASGIISLFAEDDGKIDHYILTAWTGTRRIVKILTDPFFSAESVLWYSCIAVDHSGNQSEEVYIHMTSTGAPLPENIYPANGATVTEPYVLFSFEGAVRIMYGTDPENTCYVAEHGYLPTLSNGVTYYWYAEFDNRQSPVYSFTVSYEPKELALISPENGAEITDEFPILMAEGANDLKIYIRRAGSTVEIEYPTSSFVYALEYEWFAEDESGNRSEIRTFTYLYNEPYWEEGLYMEDGQDVIYTNQIDLVPHGYAALGPNYFSYLVVKPDGTHKNQYSSSPPSAEEGTIIGKDAYGYVGGPFEDGTVVYVCLKDKEFQTSRYIRYVIDLLPPENGVPSAVYNMGWSITLPLGEDNTEATYYYRLDRGEWTAYREELTLFPEGKSYFLELFSIDLAGNTSYSSEYKTTDTEAYPIITVTEGALNRFVNTDVKITLTPAENEYLFSFYVLNGVRYPLSAECELVIRDEGIHYLHTELESPNGEIFQGEPVRIMIDKTAPCFGVVTFPTHNILALSSTHYLMVDEDTIIEENGYTIYYRFNNADAYTPYDDSGRISLTNYAVIGDSLQRSLEVKLVDEAGNEAVKQFSYVIDGKAPEVADVSIKRELDPITGKSHYTLTYSGITDDYGYVSFSRFQLFNEYEYFVSEEGESGINEPMEYDAPGISEFVYDLSDLPAGEVYHLALILVDSYDNSNNGIFNPVQRYYFYKSDLATQITIGDFDFDYSNGVYTLFRYTGSDTEITLPESVNGEPYRLAACTFYGNTTLRSVTLPASLLEIGYWAFFGASALEEVILTSPDGWETSDEAFTPALTSDPAALASYLKESYFKLIRGAANQESEGVTP